MSPEQLINKNNFDLYLKELAKEFRRLNGKNLCAEIIIVGGAAIVGNYGFRSSTVDIDAVIYASSAMKDAIRIIADRYNLPNDWINGDFTKTRSYSPKIAEFARHYRTFSNIVNVRILAAEYMIAMKLMAGRPYKHDQSDVIGILWEHQVSGLPITFDKIEKAVVDLYGDWDQIPSESSALIKDIFSYSNLAELYAKYHNTEKESRSILVQFNNQYPDVLTEDNLSSILEQVAKNKNEIV